MPVYYFVPFIVSNRYLLFWVFNGHNSVTVQNRTHVYMKFFHHKDFGNHLLQLCPKVVKHLVFDYLIVQLFLNQKCSHGKWLSISQIVCVFTWLPHHVAKLFFIILRYVINGSPHKVQTSKLEQEWPIKKCLYYASLFLGIHHIWIMIW